MDELSAKTFRARRYAPGSSDFEPISVALRGETFYYTDVRGGQVSLPMDTVSLKLGGSSSDRVVLEFSNTGETIIVSDLDFLKLLQKTQSTSLIAKQVTKARTARAFSKVQGVLFVIVIAVTVLVFGGCVYISFVLAPETVKDEQTTKQSTEQGSSSSADSDEGPPQDEEASADEDASLSEEPPPREESTEN